MEENHSTSLSALCSNDYNNGNGQNGKYGISLEDYLKIFAVLTHIDDVDKVTIFFIQWILGLLNQQLELIVYKRDA